MIGTYIIAFVGYGLAAVFSYEFVAFSLRTIFDDGLDGSGSGLDALGAACCAIIAAVVTRWLTGGAL